MGIKFKALKVWNSRAFWLVIDMLICVVAFLAAGMATAIRQPLQEAGITKCTDKFALEVLL